MPEGREGGTTWGPLYVRGNYDTAADTFTAVEARAAADADFARVGGGQLQEPDFSTPCPEPEGGWSAATDVTAFSSPEISARSELAGMWFDPATSVYTVKVVGEVATFESLIRSRYQGPVCVVPAQRTMTELMATRDALLAFRSVRVIDALILVDAAGERALASVLLDDPALQPRFDEQFGAGTVLVVPRLVRAG